MRKRTLLILAAIILPVTVAGFIAWRVGSQYRISEAEYRRINDGMTIDDVTQVVGFPPGNYCSPSLDPNVYKLNLGMAHYPSTLSRWESDNSAPLPSGYTEHQWRTDLDALRVLCDTEGNVVAWQLKTHNSESTVTRLRRRLGF